MENGTERYIETVKYLGKLYDYFNEKLFNGELAKPVITVQRDERNKSYGWWSVNNVWYGNAEECGEHELNITAQQLNRSLYDIAATLIHEMCHQYASVNGLQDTCRSGSYHNKLFKQIAETHGLSVENVAKIGWSHTTLTEDSKLLVDAFTAQNPVTFIYRKPVFEGQTVKNLSTRKYVCPCCHNSVRATKAVNILCADCNELMQEEQ